MAVVSRRVSRVHRNALTRVLRATGLASVPEEAMLVAQLRVLAKMMDEEPGTRVQQLYLSAQKDLRRVLNAGGWGSVKTPAPKAASKKVLKADEPVESVKPARNDLADFKRERGIAS